ncbi:LacI family DNA-binding transcriptional regulator, partial [Streptomyces sp. 2A115]|uniref:LacI family DNA-binding transcriptional regulator n=1 Tax=Streptomyces sp. 2A115 TaxID=3457439 RepID=UPI003FD49BAC
MPYVMVQIPKAFAHPSPAQHSVPTSADVARLAGVSRATVSYVLNNASAVRISEPTRRRVHQAAKELGYVPHAAARSLRAGHSRMVLMPAPDVPVGPLYNQFFNELQWALSRLDYTVVQYGSVGLQGDEAARAWAELRPVAVLVPGNGLGPEGVMVLKRS